MYERPQEVLSLEARNEKLRHNIDTLEIENAKLKSEASSFMVEIKGFTKKIDEFERENRKLHTNLLSCEEKYAISLRNFEEIKNEKKDRDDKVRELEKQVESQKSELAKAYEEIETQKENEQCKNTLAERLSKSRSEIKQLESNIASLEAQNADYKKRLDKMKKYCERLLNHNKVLSSGYVEKIKVKEEGQSSDNSTNENFFKDKRDESLIEFEEKQGPEESKASVICIQDSNGDMKSECSSYRKLSPKEEIFPRIKKGEEIVIENPNPNLRNVHDNSESCRNLCFNSPFSCQEKIEDARSEERKSMIEVLCGAIHSHVCRWIDVEINFIQGLLVLIIEAILLIWALLTRFVGQYQYSKWEVFNSLYFLSCGSSLFFTSLWIWSQFIRDLFKIHILPTGIGNYFAGKKFQYNYEPIPSDEPASDQEIWRGSRRSSLSSMAEEEIKKIVSPKHDSPKIFNLGSFSRLSRPVSSSSYSSNYDSKTHKTGGLILHSEFASTFEPPKGKISVTKLILKIVSLLFFAPVRTRIIKKRGTRSFNVNTSLLPTWNTWSRRRVFPNLRKFGRVFWEIFADGIRGKPSPWLTMIEMFTHFCVYTVIYIVWLKVLQSSLPHYSYYAPTYGYSHLHGWAHQLYFPEHWASKLERFSFHMITMFGVQVKNFPIPG